MGFKPMTSVIPLQRLQRSWVTSCANSPLFYPLILLLLFLFLRFFYPCKFVEVFLKGLSNKQKTKHKLVQLL